MGSSPSKNSREQPGKTEDSENKSISEIENVAETIEKIRSFDCITSVLNKIDQMNGRDVSDAKTEIQYIVDVYDKFTSKLSRSELRNYRNDIAQLVMDKRMFEFFKSVIEKYQSNDINPEKLGEETPLCLMCLDVIFRYSYDSDTMASEVAKTGILETCKKVLETCVKSHMEKRLPDVCEGIVFLCLGIVYHVSMRSTNVDRLRSLGCINTLLPYLKSYKDIVKIPCLATLANVINENECDFIKTNIRSVSRLLEVMNQGLDTADRTYEGWSCKECAEAVGKLARNDANKQLLWTMDVIPLLVEFSKIGEEDEQLEGIRAIWSLAFDKEIREDITTNKDLRVVDLLLELKKSGKTDELKAACERCLWTLLPDLKTSPIKEHKEAAKEMQWQPSTNEEKEGHIMISYQRDHREIIRKIKDILEEQNYKVWIDFDQMGGGSTLQAMANAVENASIVLVCYSRNYMNSQYCRSEAEYAYNQRKPIIPLKMERGYNPLGWLGILIGEKYFVEFSGKYEFNDKVKDLFKEIRMITEQIPSEKSETLSPSQKANPTYLLSHEEVYTPTQTVSSSQPNVNAIKNISFARQWTEADVDNWLTKYDLKNQGIDGITGEEIALLAKMHVDMPERMYKCIKRELELTSLLARSRLVWALYDLGK